MDIQIEAKPRKTFAVELVGKEYTLTAPKSAFALRMAVKSKQAQTASDPSLLIEAVDEWLEAALGPEQSQEVHDRIDDPNDDLDLEHINTLMEKVMEQTTGVPTS